MENEKLNFDILTVIYLSWEISWTEILEDYSPWSKEKFEVKKSDQIAQLMLEWIFYQEIEEVHVR